MNAEEAATELRTCGLHVTVEEGLLRGNHLLHGGWRFILKRWEDGRWNAKLLGASEQNVGPGELDKVVAVMKSWYGGVK